MKILSQISVLISLLIFKEISNQSYDYRQEQLQYENFYPYLKNSDQNNNCVQSSGIGSDLNTIVGNALLRAEYQISEVIDNNTKFIDEDVDELAGRFSTYLHQASLQAKFNEFTTQNLIKRQCLSRHEAETSLRSIRVSYLNGKQFCDLESDVSPSVKCDPNSKYSRIDGKCNNLVQTNWGSALHCQRRLLLPDYANGVNEPRVASDGSALPDPRHVTNTLMDRFTDTDLERCSMHMQWGQYLVHDSFKTVQTFGNAINGCNPKVKQIMYQDTMTYEKFAPDQLTKEYNQTCLNFVRSIGCNTCNLGFREQLNGATPVLDLSHIYGGNNNNSKSVRNFRKGALRMGTALDGSDIFPEIKIPEDQDKFDLQPCNPPTDRLWLGCLHSGDGIRANQQPMIMALNIIMSRRHNQHALALSKVNPHWNDETLFQEARRLLIAETSKIHYSEYFPSIFDKETLDYYRLTIKKDGFTEYNPYVDPNIIQSVGVAAFRFGHSQIGTRFQVVKEPPFRTSGFMLRYKFQEMADIWEGNANGIVEGLTGQPATGVDPYFSPDVHDYLFFKTHTPRVHDLPAANIQRGRDHGVPGYVYYVEYCSGIQIKNWDDITLFIPIDYVKRLTKVYKNVRDVDLYVGGLAERHVNGSILGPTFSCLIAIQAYHWKWGDRFYFEHGGQAGSFNLEQLNNIRKTVSLANLLCKTSDFESIQPKPMFMPSENNKKISCKHFKDIDYNLWREK